MKAFSFALGLMGCFIEVGIAEVNPPEELVERLSSENYPDRVAAQKALEQWAIEQGAKAWPWLKKRSNGDDSPEVQERSLEVLKSSVLEELSQKRPGFVGITMAPTELELDGGGYGVQIRMVSPGSPAEKAGLQPNDIVVELDGKGWDGIDAAESFAERVGGMSPGTKVTLGILRGDESKDVELELAARPWSAGDYGEQRRLFLRQGNFLQGGGGFVLPPQDEQQAREEAFQKWMEDQAPDTPEAPE